jgi:hypothetical protein
MVLSSQVGAPRPLGRGTKLAALFAASCLRGGSLRQGHIGQPLETDTIAGYVSAPWCASDDDDSDFAPGGIVSDEEEGDDSEEDDDSDEEEHPPRTSLPTRNPQHPVLGLWFYATA